MSKQSKINNMTITKETTIGDLNKNDRDNYTQAVLRDSKTYALPSVIDAHLLMGQAFNQIMRRCGVHVKPNDDEAQIDRMSKEHGVKVEYRTYGPEEELYRSGLFVYKRGEIAGYVSSPFVSDTESKIIQAPRFFVQTTEKDL